MKPYLTNCRRGLRCRWSRDVVELADCLAGAGKPRRLASALLPHVCGGEIPVLAPGGYMLNGSHRRVASLNSRREFMKPSGYQVRFCDISPRTRFATEGAFHVACFLICYSRAWRMIPMSLAIGTLTPTLLYKPRGSIHAQADRSIRISATLDVISPWRDFLDNCLRSSAQAVRLSIEHTPHLLWRRFEDCGSGAGTAGRWWPKVDICVLSGAAEIHERADRRRISKKGATSVVPVSARRPLAEQDRVKPRPASVKVILSFNKCCRAPSPSKESLR